MKILLVAVNAKYIHSNLAVYSLRAYAKKFKDNISIAEYTINYSEEEILKDIYNQKADVIAFSCYIWNISLITGVIKELHKVQPDVRIWFGGPEVSYDSERCLEKYEELDGIMIGEGEQTFSELAEYYLEPVKDLLEIKGIIFKNSARTYDKETQANAGITITPAREPLSLDQIPFPYENMESFRNKIIYYESSRGCPYACSYCLSSIDRGVRIRNIELVKKELKQFLEFKVPQVKFVDRTFNCNIKHAMAIWQFIKENDNGITNFHFEITADILTKEETNLLATLRPGQVQLEIGVQTTNPETMKAIQRKVDFGRLSENVLRIHKEHNIHQHLDLIAGLPLEDFPSFEKSFNDVYRLKPEKLQLGFLKVLKGSHMEKVSAEYGIVYRSTPPYEVLYTDALPYSELLKLKGVCEMVEVYYNSGQFDYTIRFLEHFFETPIRLYLALHDYYEEMLLYGEAHSRSRRYEILLDFYKRMVLKSDIGESTLFGEILLYDMCLREDIKSRPYFASKPMEHKKIREIRDADHISPSTRIEHFNYDIIASAGAGRAVKKDRLVLFDYGSRDPVSNSARVMTLDEFRSQKED